MCSLVSQPPALAFYDKVVVDGALMSFLRVLRSLTEHV
jgi:hypothetical protein